MNAPVPERSPNPADMAVEAEWRKIEQERIAEEVEEAREDLIEAAAAPRRHWPWAAVAVALVAGVILAAVLNSPRFRRPGGDGVDDRGGPQDHDVERVAAPGAGP